MLGHGDAEPTQKYRKPGEYLIKASELAQLNDIFSKLLTRNQTLILFEINEGQDTITSLLTRISEANRIPLSTLKSSAKSLKELNLIGYGDSSTFMKAELTPIGKAVLLIIGDSYT